MKQPTKDSWECFCRCHKGPIGREFTDRFQWCAKCMDTHLLIKKLSTTLEEQITGETSDGYHTFNELYEFRKVYNAVLFNEWSKQGKYSVHKSKKHSDGEDCFGGGWFIVTATLPTGQISNHYELKDWDLFNCEEREKADVWDGHTAQDVLTRLASLPREKEITPKTTVEEECECTSHFVDNPDEWIDCICLKDCYHCAPKLDGVEGWEWQFKVDFTAPFIDWASKESPMCGELSQILEKQIDFISTLLSDYKSQLKKEIEGMEPVKRGKWVMHYDWISKKDVLERIKEWLK